MRSWLFWLLCWPFGATAINVGTLTFAMDQDQSFTAKRVLNNNRSARIYQVTVRAIDRPGEKETRSRPADGELLFAPLQLQLQAGQGEYYKFFYRGPQDDRERYYRVSFREIPTRLFDPAQRQTSAVNLEPIVVMDTILVVRPRQSNFAYRLDPQRGTLTNTGNTYFKFLLKPGCDSTDEEGITEYLRPGDTLTHAGIRLKGQKFVIYNDKFISVDKSCIN
ncbi:fimbria/pilus periplasmic chaperone [Serratia quinivorans]|uniref:fimbria/pilus periplasmic chaperone n=1 Tax=Serratia quinivorans TaxID=137545 RepID=UPI001C4450C4|nr:fimbria/pilus periplasmic chaperone [Serratia quinivorans]MBV6690899.1 fimbria/pilus periplasmic chaperone [Serratia quinivorans]